MAVTRTLHKYRRPLMVVFASVLMIMFLLQDARCFDQGPRLSTDASSVQGTAFDSEKINLGALAEARDDLNFLEIAVRVGDLQSASRFTSTELEVLTFLLNMSNRNDLEPALALVLLDREAINTGVQAAPTGAFTDDDLARFRDQTKIGLATQRRALTRLARVALMADLALPAGPRYSPPQIAATIRDGAETFLGSYVDVPALMYMNDVSPTPEKAAQLFEQFKNELPQEDRKPDQVNADSFNIGYRTPLKLRVEALIFDLPLFVANESEPTDLIVRREYDRSVPKPGEAGHEPYSLAAPRLRQQIRESRAADQMRAAASQALAQASIPWATVEPGKPLPKDRWVSYDTLADELARRPRTPRPRRVEILGSYRQLGMNPDLQGLQPANQRGATQITELLFHTIGADAELRQPQREALRPVGKEPLELLVSRTRQGAIQKFVMLRVIEILPSKAPASLDDIVDGQPILTRALEDARRVLAYEAALADARTLASLANEKKNLIAAIEADPQLWQRLSRNPRIRFSPPTPTPPDSTPPPVPQPPPLIAPPAAPQPEEPQPETPEPDPAAAPSTAPANGAQSAYPHLRPTLLSFQDADSPSDTPADAPSAEPTTDQAPATSPATAPATAPAIDEPQPVDTTLLPPAGMIRVRLDSLTLQSLQEFEMPPSDNAPGGLRYFGSRDAPLTGVAGLNSQRIVQQLFKRLEPLLADPAIGEPADPDNAPPIHVEVIELPGAREARVLYITGVRRAAATRTAQRTTAIRESLMQPFARDSGRLSQDVFNWMRLDAVMARTGFVPAPDGRFARDSGF